MTDITNTEQYNPPIEIIDYLSHNVENEVEQEIIMQKIIEKVEKLVELNNALKIIKNITSSTNDKEYVKVAKLALQEFLYDLEKNSTRKLIQETNREAKQNIKCYLSNKN